MFTARRISSTEVEDVQCLNRLHAWDKTLVIKNNGDFDIFSSEGLHTYRQLWSERIFDTGYSEALSTLFVQCERSLVLFNVGNMEQYDKIVDKRGILGFWCLENHCENEVDQRTVVVILLNTRVPKIKVLTWVSKSFLKMVEIPLSSKNEHIASVNLVDQGTIIATNKGVFLCKFGGSELISIDKAVTPKLPACLPDLLQNLYEVIDHSSSNDNESVADSFAWSSISGLWLSEKRKRRAMSSKNIRYMFNIEHVTCFLLDGNSQMLLQFNATDDGLFYLKALPHENFFQRNIDFDRCLYLGSNFMALYNTSSLRIVDYEQGFVFLDIDIPNGIKKVYHQNEAEIIIWTTKGVIETYRIDIDESLDMAVSSKNGSMFDLNFDTLEKRTVFYRNILKSEHLPLIKMSDDNNELIISCVMKLRDFCIVYALQAFDRAQKLYYKSNQQQFRNSKTADLYDTIIKRISQLLLQFLAPPVLTIFYCFPEIAETMSDLFPQKNLFLRETSGEIPINLVKKGFIPYLTEVRRHLKNIRNGNETVWSYDQIDLKLTLSFFQNHNQEELSVNELLTIVDTTLFEIYVKCNKTMVGSLVRVENSCDFTIVEHLLKKEKMIHELIDFYFYNGQHKKALMLLTEMLDHAGNLENALKTLIIDYLKKLVLTDLKLVFQYSDLLLNRYPDELFEILTLIFLQPLPISKELSHNEIYEYIDSKRPELSLSYLEFVVGELQYSDSKIFCTLVKRYLTNISDQMTIRKLHAVLKSSKDYDPRSVLRILKNSISEHEQGHSSEVKALKYLSIYPLRLMGDHEVALCLLWDDLNDYQQSSEYCESLYKTDKVNGSKLLMLFLDKILEFDDENRKAQLLKIFLTEHGFKLNSDQVLLKLPMDISIADVSTFFNTELKDKTSKQNDLNLLKGILTSEMIKANYDLANVLSEFFVLSEERKCPMCNRPLKNTPTEYLAIMSYKNKPYVMCLNCARKLQAKLQQENTMSSKEIPTLAQLI